MAGTRSGAYHGIKHAVDEISLILKNTVLITLEEFRILDRYSCPGKIWTLIHRPTSIEPYIAHDRRIEYIFDAEALTIFYMVSRNVLATWNTDITRNLGPNDEYQIRESLFITPYSNISI